MWSVMNYLNAIDLYKLLHFPRAFDHKDLYRYCIEEKWSFYTYKEISQF